MKFASILIFISTVVLLIVYSGSKEIFPFKNTACAEPLTYRIGEIDPRFDISKEEVKNSMQEAADAWSAVVNLPVAEFSEQGEIVVQLVYDDRQKLMTNEISHRKKLSAIERQISNYESVYKGLTENFEQKLKVYQQQEKNLQKQLKSFNEWVDKKNKEGGFKENEVSAFKRRKADIESLKSDIDREKNELNRLDNQLSERVDAINEVIAEQNALVEEYNQEYSGKKDFIQGIFEVKGSDKKIKVFHYLDTAELRLVLAHELGHALGIQHVSDSKAVMFDHTKNQSKTTLKLTEQDIEAISKICNTVGS